MKLFSIIFKKGVYKPLEMWYNDHIDTKFNKELI
tara:strand:- start:258 stop:359 length:102 start_codon:yes stop_codon:yes gene_type:complete